MVGGLFGVVSCFVNWRIDAWEITVWARTGEQDNTKMIISFFIIFVTHPV